MRGWDVCKQGTRYAALEPLCQGLMATAGKVGPDAGRGLSLRMDHGTQYLSDHFLNQLRYWGILPSFAFIEQLQTNGVAERFNRILKEQAIHGRVFHTLEDVRWPWRISLNGTMTRGSWRRTASEAPAKLGRIGRMAGICYEQLNANLCPENRTRYTLGYSTSRTSDNTMRVTEEDDSPLAAISAKNDLVS